MPKVHIDISIFSTPCDAFGYASGEVDLDEMPVAQRCLIWPVHWKMGEPRFFCEDNALVLSVSPWPSSRSASTLVSMYGIVCEGVEDARTCGAFLEAQGLDVIEY